MTIFRPIFDHSSITERAQLRQQWAQERQEMEAQIDKINEEIQKKEAELAKLVAIDNELWRQACELELEIRGYKAMMFNENQNSRFADAYGVLNNGDEVGTSVLIKD